MTCIRPNAPRLTAICLPTRLPCPHPFSRAFSLPLRSHHNCATFTTPLKRPIPINQHAFPQSRRHRSTYEATASLFRRHPFSATLAFLIIATTSSILIYTNYYYKVHIVGDFARYPEPVAQKLRRAIYYTNIDLQPKEAFKYYKQALGVAAQLQMDPYCEEVVGIKIELARMFEKADLTKNAVEVLEIVRRELGEWMVTQGGRKDGGLGGTIVEAAEGQDQGLFSSVTDASKRLVGQEDVQGGEAKGVDWAKRTVVLRTLIRTHVKLGDLYSDASLNEQALAEERLVWAVTALLKERKRREDEGEKEGESELFPDNEVGAALESLADHYSSQSKHYLSTPLYLQSLAFNPSTCHTVILMNNLATALAQQGGPADTTPPSLAATASAAGSGMPPPSSSATQLSNAEQWATKALKLGQSIQPPARTQECDVGCAVATITLGDLARLEGRREKARRYWEEGRGLAKVVGYAEGVQRAEEGLKAL